MTSIIGHVTTGLKNMFQDDNKRLIGGALMLGTALNPAFGAAVAVTGVALGAGRLVEADKVLKDDSATAEEKLAAQEDADKAILTMSTSMGISSFGGGLTALGISSILNMYDGEDSENKEILSTLEQEQENTQEV